MNDNRFQIAFTGKLVAGADLAQVKAKMARLFKAAPEKIEPLFSGKRFIIKKGLDEATARKYQLALRQAGALVEIVDTAPPAAGPVAAAKSAEPAGSLAGVTVDEPGVRIVEPEQVTPPDIDVSSLSMAERGVQLVEHSPAPPLEVDLSDLSMAEVGVTLIEPEQVAELEVDLSALSMAEPGVTLVEPEPVAPPEIDTSRLRLE